MIELIEAVALLRAQLQDDERPEYISTESDAVYDVEYDVDEDGEEYALLVETMTPFGVYAEIDGQTFGTLRGWRVYI